MCMLIENKLYIEDIENVCKLSIDFKKLENKTILISGATGMIGSFLIDVLMYQNKFNKLNIKIIALGRNREKAQNRFSIYWNDLLFSFHQCNLNQHINIEENVDYVIHLASNTHPVAYATDPIGTITANIYGTFNLLEIAAKNVSSRFLFASSNEIYGENRGDVEQFDESYCGYIDSNTLRAGYPESKRCGEALCQAFSSQKGVDFVIARLTRTFGPTLLESDTKALSQFIKNGLSGENIILKSEGNQFFSYCYVADAASALLFILTNGVCKQAYNVSNEKWDIRLKDLAQKICEISSEINSIKIKVDFQLPSKTESIGFSKATKARLNGQKLCKLGWKPIYSLDESLKRNFLILKSIK